MGGEIDAGLGAWVALAALPLLLAACTAFTKLTIVLSALRVGMGAQVILPGGIVMAFAFVLTVLVMGPTGAAVYDAFVDAGGIAAMGNAGVEGWLSVTQPLQDFMRLHTHPGELDFVAELGGLPATDPRVLVSAFMISELSEALVIAVLLILPFVLVDFIVAQLLSLLDLEGLPPKVVALPAKILLFLLAGGWDLILGGVLESYA